MKNLILLPHYFKKIGISILIILFISYVIFFTYNFSVIESNLTLINQLAVAFACIAMFFLNFYKRKNEDETWILKRLHCLFFSFFIGINFFLLNALLNVISGGDFYNLGSELIFFILLFNLVQMIGLRSNDKIKN